MRLWRLGASGIRNGFDSGGCAASVRAAVILAGLTFWVGCAGGPPSPQELSRAAAPVPADDPASTVEQREQPVADGPWRVHVLARCHRPDTLPTVAENSLALSNSLYRDHEGSDAIMELELCLEENGEHGMILLTLGQLYLLAGLGAPDLLPTEGPAADVGDWPRNQRRLLRRAATILERAAAVRGDDGVVDYLRADVAGARGDQNAADSLFALGRTKCTLPRSVATVRQYQRLNRYPPYLLSTLAPAYPADAVAAGISGDVVLDVLVDPRGDVYQVAEVSSPDPSLTAAAARAARDADYRPAKIGRYPVWSWLRITAKYSLDG